MIYICLSCDRAVDADEEPSAGEPRYCPDCYLDRQRELDDEMARRLLDWGQSA